MPSHLFAPTPLFPLAVVLHVLPRWRSGRDAGQPDAGDGVAAVDRRSERCRTDEQRMERVLVLIEQRRRAALPFL